jgi:hypothetical protein
MFVCAGANGCCRIIAREIYGATDIEISEKAAEQMERFVPRGALPHAKFSAGALSSLVSSIYLLLYQIRIQRLRRPSHMHGENSVQVTPSRACHKCFVRVPSCSSELSLSHDPNARGVPGPFVLPIREIRARLAIMSSPSRKKRAHPFLQRWRRISVSARRRHVRARLRFCSTSPPHAAVRSTIPGLPTRPAFFDVDVDPETNAVQGLF